MEKSRRQFKRHKKQRASGFSRIFATSEAWCGPQLWPHGFGIHAWRRRSLWRRRARLFRKRLAFHEQLHFSCINDFAFKQSLSDALQNILIAGKSVACPFIGGADDALHFFVDLNGGVFGIIAVLGDFAAKEDGFVLLAESQRAEFA